MIALLGGTGPQQESLEPYHIIAVNLSHFGQDLIATPTSSDVKPSETTGSSLWDQLADDARGLGGDITDGINNITNEVADKVTEELGISQWYSLHVMTLSQKPGLRLNLTEILDHEIKAGPLHLNVNQIKIPKAVQNAIDTVNDALLALLVIYALASGLSGLSFLISLAVLVLIRKKVNMLIIWANVAISGLDTLVLLIGSAILTYVNNKGVQAINDAGKDVGISGIRGTKFITLSWVSFGLMLFTALYWALPTLKYTKRWIIIADNSRHRGEKTLPYAHSFNS
ncbi:hypothetical protein EKO27_g4614 [Xylaria grammica]|uniref:Uncharacterized protein n=1 Tax=Xylaria grammica TaxID=363999 RepID=A0A439D7W7_9PEZI|nr:hypothetical protein EKO27_g4614 [Xylaria grammica]